MGGCAKSISHNKESEIGVRVLGHFEEDIVDFDLTEIPICFDDRDSEVGLELFIGCAHD